MLPGGRVIRIQQSHNLGPGLISSHEKPFFSLCSPPTNNPSEIIPSFGASQVVLEEKNLPHKRCQFYPGAGKIPWKRAWPPTPIFLPGESHGQRSLVGYIPWRHKRVRHDWALLDPTHYWRLRTSEQYDLFKTWGRRWLWKLLICLASNQDRSCYQCIRVHKMSCLGLLIPLKI